MNTRKKRSGFRVTTLKKFVSSVWNFECTTFIYGLMAQLVRAPPCHGGGRGFESLWGRLETWDLSSAGRASALQAEGHRFEPCRSHFYKKTYITPMWLNWQSSWFVISRLSVRVRSSALYNFILYIMGRFPSGQRGQTVNLLQLASVVRIHLCPFSLLENNIISRDGAVWKLAGLITRRS